MTKLGVSNLAVLAMLTACAGFASTPAAPAPVRGIALPVLVENHRWFLQTRTRDGAPLRLYLDSAGGMFITKAAAERLRLPVNHIKGEDGEMDVVRFPALDNPSIPRPKPDDAFPVFATTPFPGTDGMFGAPWFAGHVFTFDYPGARLTLREPGDLPTVPPEHRIFVAFQRGAKGEIVSPYGRIQMIVDGKTIDMLFDTGATFDLTDRAVQALGGAARQRAGSFITESVFRGWRSGHPGWRVIDGADGCTEGKPAPMIEVPEVTVGGYRVGPVWFSQRPDKNFHEWMVQWMDGPTEGALGGSAFHSLRVTVDWTAGVAAFER